MREGFNWQDFIVFNTPKITKILEPIPIQHGNYGFDEAKANAFDIKIASSKFHQYLPNIRYLHAEMFLDKHPHSPKLWLSSPMLQTQNLMR